MQEGVEWEGNETPPQVGDTTELPWYIWETTSANPCAACALRASMGGVATMPSQPHGGCECNVTTTTRKAIFLNRNNMGTTETEVSEPKGTTGTPPNQKRYIEHWKVTTTMFQDVFVFENSSETTTQDAKKIETERLGFTLED